jgi:hypothetical protein
MPGGLSRIILLQILHMFRSLARINLVEKLFHYRPPGAFVLFRLFVGDHHHDVRFTPFEVSQLFPARVILGQRVESEINRW